MDLAEMRDLVEADLHDSANAVWSTDEIDRAIQLAVQEFSYAIPVEDSTTEAAVASRDIDISALSTRVMIQAVEYPTGNYPKTYVRFAVWGDTLTLLVDTAPDGTYDAEIYYGKLQTLLTASAWVVNTAYALGDYVLPTTPNGYRYVCTTAGTSHATTEPTWPTTIGGTVTDGTAVWTCDCVTSSIPPIHENLISRGSQGFAMIQWSAEGINRVNVGGKDVAATYERQGRQLLRDFRYELRRLGRQNRVRVRQLYTPAYPIVSKNTVVGP